MPEKQKESRFDHYKSLDAEIIWPHVTAQYLLNHIWEITPFQQTGMGLIPLNWQEISNWQAITGINLKPWELKIVKAGSSAYVHQASISTDVNCAPPTKPIQQDAEKLVNHIKSIFR